MVDKGLDGFPKGAGKVRIGQGYDIHRLVEGRPLILGGIRIPYEKGLLGHSDADVLTHAIMDALLGAAALRDIGFYFPRKKNAGKGPIASFYCSKWCNWWAKRAGALPM
jgi:2-C-methyl-D-erythritol 4-phosphate cytidylyltransferase/2-C-methyl-D-erythritol 2,4-cyclodiphosphate synthase